MDEELLTTKEFADLYGVSDRTVRRWIENGQILAVSIGRGYKIPADEVPPSYEETPSEDGNPSAPDFEPYEPLFVPELPEPDEDNTGQVDILDPDAFPGEDLRRIFTTVEDAEDYASDIPVPTQVFQRDNDLLFQVVVMYP